MKDPKDRSPPVGSIWGAAWNLLLLGSLVATNILTLYSLTVSRELDRYLMTATKEKAIQGSFLQELTSIREELQRTQREVLDTRQDIQNSQKETLALLGDHASASGESTVGGLSLKSIDAGGRTPHSLELTAYSSVRRLPLGRNPTHGEETMVSPVGHACYQSLELLEKYMNYTVGQLCPDDWDLAQKLMVKGCEPLPRRRCFSRTPPAYSSPLPFPQSVWSNPPDDTVLWTHHTCKSFGCLNRRAKESKVFTDCADCFDLEGPEKNRWTRLRDRYDFRIEEVLAVKGGTIRIGLDLGGGSGSFAARLAEFNVTIITSTLNLNGPFNEFVALRGFLPLYITVSQRLPFFDNTLDLVHSMHVLSHWIPPISLEFLLFDIDRVLRPGGLFWLDHFFCTNNQMQSTFLPMLRKLGFIEHKWVTGNKTDPNGVKNKEVYLSALLEKPIREAPLISG